MIQYAVIQPLAGGFALGAEQAIGSKPKFIVSDSAFGFNNSFLLDYWQNTVPCYDFTTCDTLPSTELDFVLSVPVCAGLSQLNSSKQRGADAPQNANMLFNAEYAMSKLKPKVYVFENAPALYTSVGAPVVKKLRKIASDNGYVVSLYKTNTLHHGIPQNRKRTFAMFWRGKECPVMEYEDRRIDLPTYLKQIPADATLQDTYVNADILNDPLYIYLSNELSDVKKEYFDRKSTSLMNLLIKTGLIDSFIAWCEDKGHEKDASVAKHVKTKLSMGKNYWDNSLCFASDEYVGAIQGRMYGRIIHPTEDRDFSVRELIHLMGHPHDYQINDIKDINVIAQNVPVSTSKFITGQVIKYINGQLIDSGEKFLKQDNTASKNHTEISSLSSFF